MLSEVFMIVHDGLDDCIVNDGLDDCDVHCVNGGSVANLDHFDADPVPTFHFDAHLGRGAGSY